MTLTLILLALATYRLSVLVTSDVITEPLRAWWLNRFPTEEWFYEEKRVDAGEVNDDEQLFGTVRVWPFTRQVAYVGETWLPVKVYKLGSLIECFYCVSVWVAAGLTLAFLPITLDSILYFAAVAGGAEIVNNRLGR